ncbi:CubicO group peptidase, beta-lactamase class C family [Streptosporangium canum]|uniref:CubicO group peptidase, beta-lactamase class C family n=1 Tax=Streptosporangium canum TaxID=324952 RepID=A0A1I4A3Z9_9ACTN|nr:CubicO group peptidase, beta-lactamase class C family [Streptosporangium canum]
MSIVRYDLPLPISTVVPYGTVNGGHREEAVGLFGVTLAQLVLASAAAAAPPGRALDATAVDSYMNDYLARTGLPGAVVAVTRGDQVIRAAGYGHGADGRTLTAGTPMPVASLSKSFTALAVMQLVEAGKVNLDTPVRHYLPEFEMADPRAGKITVRQLLNQTSGMADSAFPDLALPQSDTLAGAVARMRGAKLSGEPGTKMNYHNPNYFVAARLVEVVSGVPFADHMSGKVFGPLGMKASTTVNTTKDMPGGAKGYIRAYGQVIPRSHPYWFANGSQGVVTTADDLTRWLIMQNNKGRSAHGRQIVSTRSIETMRAPSKGSSYGMGWSTSEPEQGPVRIQHTGWLLTHNAMQTLLPDGGSRPRRSRRLPPPGIPDLLARAPRRPSNHDRSDLPTAPPQHDHADGDRLRPGPGVPHPVAHHRGTQSAVRKNEKTRRRYATVQPARSKARSGRTRRGSQHVEFLVHGVEKGGHGVQLLRAETPQGVVRATAERAEEGRGEFLRRVEVVHVDHAPVVHVADPADVPGPLQPVEARGDGARREVQLLPQPARGDRRRSIEDLDEGLDVGGVQPVLVGELVGDAVELGGHPAQPYREGLQVDAPLVIAVHAVMLH